MLNLSKRLIDKIKSDPIYLYIFLYFLFLIVLSFFRDASADEAYYLKETNLIAELLKKGIWIGNYGVGLHGFLFKLPVAIAFIVLGKGSVFIATCFTILLSASSLLLFYKIVNKRILEKKYATLSVILLSVALHFIGTSISFNRDIPALFTVLLFLYVFFENKNNNLLIGIIFLLMLDAKEHVFLTVAPLYMFYLFIEWVRKINCKKFWSEIKVVFCKSFLAYIPAVAWIVLMFTTSVIPINMFIPSILGFTKTGQDWNMGHFTVEIGSQNSMGEGDKEIGSVSEITVGSVKENFLNIEEKCTMERSTICIIIDGLNILTAYIGKILYPRTFSFISVPKIIALPAIIYSITFFKEWFRKKDKKYLLSLILWFNVMAVILRASHGRYLLAVVPIFMIFFIMFIKDGLKNQKLFKKILISTTVFVILGLFFESTYLELKIILEISILVLLWAIWFLRNQGESIINFSKTFFIITLSLAMFLTTLTFSYKIGQISNYLKYGYNRGAKEIAAQFDIGSKIWLNDYESKDIIDFYRGNFYIEPQWDWKLVDWLPKKYLLKTYGEDNTLVFNISDMKTFEEDILENKIEKIVFLKSVAEGEKLPFEERETEFFSQDWLKYERKVQLKNKIMYIFKVGN